ncbi:carbonyl reductase [NADPH] 1 [Biomphalaria glabrata]|nr:carbonyl reductase [NADPH] 1 [Biomphalaria glabrata]
MCLRIAVVTGANKGIGFATLRALCRQFNGDVLLTARNVDLGKKAVEELEKEGLHPKFHQLDLNNHSSVVTLRNFLQDNYGGLDILVNNAGIASKSYSAFPFSEEAKVITKTNFFDTLHVCQVLFPLLRPHARVVNVSSSRALLALKECSDTLKVRLTDSNITMEELTSIIKTFVDTAQKNHHQEAGFPSNAYWTSKLGVTVMSMIQQKELDAKGSEDVVVNACCPGYVRTDMTNHQGDLSIDEGADTPVYCALLPPKIHQPRGKFIMQKQVVSWEA